MPSGAELIRQVKEQIREVDPREVHDLVHENGSSDGAVVLDVREQYEFEESHLPGAVHVPRGHLESRVEGAVPDKAARVIAYCTSGNRSALAAKTMQEELGYENVESMRGGITLWKDNGYEVDVPRSLTPEQRERYSRHLLIPEIGLEGQMKLLDADNIMEIIDGYDVVVDGLDNFPTRYLLNDASVRLGIPVVSASILGFEGQLSVFKPHDGPCYRCLYPTPPPAELAPSCGAAGVLGATFTELKVRRDSDCPICSIDPGDISEEEMGRFPDYEAFCAGAG